MWRIVGLSPDEDDPRVAAFQADPQFQAAADRDFAALVALAEARSVITRALLADP